MEADGALTCLLCLSWERFSRINVSLKWLVRLPIVSGGRCRCHLGQNQSGTAGFNLWAEPLCCLLPPCSPSGGSSLGNGTAERMALIGCWKSQSDEEHPSARAAVRLSINVFWENTGMLPQANMQEDL